MCRLQFYRNIQKKSTNPSIRTLVSTLQCRFLCVFRILPYAHSANVWQFLREETRGVIFSKCKSICSNQRTCFDESSFFCSKRQYRCSTTFLFFRFCGKFCHIRNAGKNTLIKYYSLFSLRNVIFTSPS